MTRRLALISGAIVALLAAAPPASADVRTATAGDAPDPGVTFDVARVDVATDRDAGTLTLSAHFHAPIPEAPSGGGPHYFVVWVEDAAGSGCAATYPGTVGDTYVNVSPSADGSLTATVNVKHRQEYGSHPVTVSADRRQLSLQVTDELLKQSNHRCVRGAGSGQATYDPSQPGGGSSYDSFGPVWFAGQEPPPAAPPSPGGGEPTGGDPGVAECSSPLLRLRGSERVAHGNLGFLEVTLDEDYASEYSGGAKLTMRKAHSGEVFFEHAFDAGDDRVLRDDEGVWFYIDLDPERRPAVVTLTWTQTDYSGATASCSALVSVRPIRGLRPAFSARGGGVAELLPRGRCSETRVVPISISVRGRGRTARFRRTDPCGAFRGRSRTIASIRVFANDYGGLSFSARGRGRATLTVRAGRRVLLRRTVVSRVRSRPDRRVFEGTDAFFNYCIKRNRELFSHRLRLYCIRPGSYRAAVVFRR